MNYWEERVAVKKEELRDFLYYIVKSKNISQKVCCVSTESDLKRKLEHWDIKKPGLVFSFSDGINPKVKHLLSETVPSSGVAIIVEEPSKNKVFKKVVKDIEIESGLTQPTTIGLVSRTKTNDLYKELDDGGTIELSEGWRSLSECTHVVFVQNSYEQKSAYSCLTETIANGAPVVVFVNTESKDIFKVKSFAKEHIVVDINTSLMDRQTMNHRFKNSTQDFRESLVQSLVDAIPGVSDMNSVVRVLNLAVDLKANVDIGKSIESLKNSDKHSVVANAFRNDNWSQINTFMTNKKHKRAFYESLLLLLHEEEKKPKFCERLLLLLHGKMKTEKKTNKDLLQKIANDYFDLSGVKITLSSTNKQQQINNTILCLFLWAILHQRFNVAKGLWMQTRNMMAAAILAYKILQDMIICKRYAVDELKKLKIMADSYEDSANEILNQCLQVKKEYTKKILVRKRDEFDGKSLLQIAKYNEPFMAHDACHSQMNDIWFCPLEIESKGQPILLILMCVFLPFLAPLLLRFRKEIAVGNNNNEEQGLNGYGKMIFGFLNAPVVKFIYYFLAFLIFLASFGYDLIFDVSELTWNDGIVIAFVVSFTTEEIRQMYIKQGNYIRNVWDCVDISSLALFISGQSLTNIPYSSEGGRVLLAISFIGFCIRLLQVFASLSQIGPFLIMIARMLVDTVHFLGVLIVVVISYAVSSRAVLYPNTAFTWPSLYTTFRKPFWHIFGELFLDELTGDAECEAGEKLTNSTAFCPSTMARYVTPVMLGVYMVIVQLLLINLLIAKFTKTFERVHDDIEKHWRLLHSELIKEYCGRTMIFPPFSSIYHMCIFIRFCAKRFCAKRVYVSSTNDHIERKYKHSYSVAFQQRENINLQTWENKRAQAVPLQKRRNPCPKCACKCLACSPDA